MQPLLVLPVLAFLILLTLFLLVLRRAGRFIAATRDVERFRRQVGDLAGRVEVSLGEICARVDAVRRGSLGADMVADDIAASLDAVGQYETEARALRPPIDGVAKNPSETLSQVLPALSVFQTPPPDAPM